eukprot:Pgem_evm2s16199
MLVVGDVLYESPSEVDVSACNENSNNTNSDGSSPTIQINRGSLRSHGSRGRSSLPLTLRKNSAGEMEVTQQQKPPSTRRVTISNVCDEEQYFDDDGKYYEAKTHDDNDAGFVYAIESELSSEPEEEVVYEHPKGVKITELIQRSKLKKRPPPPPAMRERSKTCLTVML